MVPRASETRRAVRSLQRLAQPLRSTLIPNRPHPYLRAVASAQAFSDHPRSAWEVVVPRAGFALALAHERESGAGVLWLRPAGRGTIIVSAFGSLFANRALGVADNARLLANIVTASLGSGGAVLFDDTHQGLTAIYDPAKFYRDPRLYATLGVLLAVVAIVGLGTSGTQTLIYGFVANYYRTNVRGAGVAWCAGFGRLGGVGGPLLGGLLIRSGLALDSIFYVLAAIGVLGVVLTVLVPTARGPRELHSTSIEPSIPAKPGKLAAVGKN